LKIDTRVVVHKWEGKRGSDLVGRSCEMSEGGIGVFVPDRLEVGSNVMVSLSLFRDAKGLRIPAVVKNQRGSRCGLEFVDLQESERDEIANYLGSLIEVVQS
jgi:c-di-GMP-binding flagellar brake protein YcgR